MKNNDIQKIVDALDYEPRRGNFLTRYATFPTEKYDALLRTKQEDVWVAESKIRALRLFHDVATRVPAYKHFLKKHKINSKKISDITDFSFLPHTDKKNYIEKYSLQDRSFDGNVMSSNIIASSSGTTGVPKYWPRGGYQEFEAAVIHEMLYKYLFKFDKKRTLLVIGFPMGIYVSGVATTIPSIMVSHKYSFSIITGGTSSDDIERAVAELYRENCYDQLVIAGHPFFAKGIAERIKKNDRTKKISTKMLLCSEGFSEVWRKYIMKVCGAKSSDIISAYGSSEMLLMGHETALSIAIKEVAEKNKIVQTSMNPDGGVWALFQYNPLLRYIEQERNELLFTSASGIPLVRYNMKDRGRIFRYDDLKSNSNLSPIFEKKQDAWKLPFVSLGGRSDQSLVLYAANIYPEHIHKALNNVKYLGNITGKFSMEKRYIKSMEQEFLINIELKKGIAPQKKLSDEIQKHIIKTLKSINMEYLFIVRHSAKERAYPKIILRTWGDTDFFPPGRKPKYIIN